MRRLFFLLLILLGIYVAYPYWTLYRLDQALLNNDKESLEKIIDFPSVRASLKAQAQGGLIQKSRELAEKRPVLGDIGEALARAIGPSVVGGTVDGLVTPEAILENPTVVEHREKNEGFEDALKYAFFSGPTTFKVQSKNPKEPDSPVITAYMTLEGPRWRVTRVELPPFEALVPDMVSPEPETDGTPAN